MPSPYCYRSSLLYWTVALWFLVSLQIVLLEIHSPVLQPSVLFDSSFTNSSNDTPAKFFVLPTDWFQNRSATRCMSIWSSNLYEAMLNHPRRTTDVNEATVVLPDFEQAKESNWPVYGNGHLNWISGHSGVCSRSCGNTVRYSNLISAMRVSLPVIRFDSQGTGKATRCGDHGQRIVTACVSCHQNDFRTGLDIGFPAPPIVQFSRTKSDVLQHCIRAKFLLTFKGAGRDQGTGLRRSLRTLSDGSSDIRIIVKGAKRPSDIQDNFNLSHPLVSEYAFLMLNSQFGVVARGDNLFSYRLLEVMSAGVIPVIFSDYWVLPFQEIINWDDIAIRIDESDISQTVPILRSFSSEDICAMRARVLDVYLKYLSSFSGMISGILDTFEYRQSNVKIAEK